MLPSLQSRPSGMSKADWAWLLSLLFGAVVFSTSGIGVPLLKTVASGDLDGDFYFVCWDVEVLSHVTEQLLPAGDTCQLDETAEEATVQGQTDGRSRGGLGDQWLALAQDHMTNVDFMRDTSSISKLYFTRKRKREEFGSMNHPDALALADAYAQMIDHGKHSGGLHLYCKLRQYARIPPLKLCNL